MTQLTQFFANLSLSDPTVWLALASGFAVVLVFLFLGRKQRRPVTVVVSSPAGTAAEAPDSNPADAWLPPPKRPDERRRASRRTGVPTPIQLLDPKKPKKVLDGFVVDRSSGGLRVAVEKPYPTGTTLQIRPTNAPPEVSWVLIIVRNCKETGDYYELGCQFQEELPWNVLLMFG